MTRKHQDNSLARRANARFAIFSAGALALFAAPALAAAPSNDPHGTWLRDEGGVQFSFYDCNGLLCAKVIGAKSAEDRASIGTVILRGASKHGEEWRGKLYNADDGKTYDGFITVSGNTLSLKGCLWGVLCSGETWRRIGPPPAPPTAPSAAAAPPPGKTAAAAMTAPAAGAKPLPGQVAAKPAPAPAKQAAAPTPAAKPPIAALATTPAKPAAAARPQTANAQIVPPRPQMTGLRRFAQAMTDQTLTTQQIK